MSKISDYTNKKNLIKKLDQPKETCDLQTEEHYLSGKVKNIQIQEHAYGFYIQGSLPKYYFGNNIQTLTTSQLKECVNNLSEELDLPITEFGISRVDITDNIVMTHKPQAYCKCLHSCTWFDKSILPNGVRFSNNSRTLSFYDKIEERLNKQQPVPEEFKNKNLFRYEYRIDERFSDYLKFSTPNITAFYSQENCEKVIDVWQNQFDKITKVESSLTKVSDLSRFLKYRERNEVEFLLNNGGEGAALDEIELLHKLGKYEYRRQVAREKKRIKKLFEKFNSISNTGYSFKNELIERVHEKASANKIILLE